MAAQMRRGHLGLAVMRSLDKRRLAVVPEAEDSEEGESLSRAGEEAGDREALAAAHLGLTRSGERNE